MSIAGFDVKHIAVIAGVVIVTLVAYKFVSAKIPAMPGFMPSV